MSGGRGDLRENSIRFKNLRLFSVYRVEKKPIRPLLNYLASNKITVYNVKMIDEKTAEFSVKFKDDKKFFAKCEELCYNNIIKVKEEGLFLPFFNLLRFFGLTLGAFAFFFIALFSDGFILSVEYYGEARELGAEVSEYLSSIGIKKFSRFSSFSLEELEDLIVVNSDGVSFSSVEKCGNVLKIRLEPSESKAKTVNKRKEIVSDVDGVIESIKVYSGTAVKNVGEKVANGELVVSGTVNIKDNEVKTEALATVTVIARKEFVFTSEKEGEAQFFEELAKESVEKDIVRVSTAVKEDGGKYEYTVSIEYRHVL